MTTTYTQIGTLLKTLGATLNEKSPFNESHVIAITDKEDVAQIIILADDDEICFDKEEGGDVRLELLVDSFSMEAATTNHMFLMGYVNGRKVFFCKLSAEELERVDLSDLAGKTVREVCNALPDCQYDAVGHSHGYPLPIKQSIGERLLAAKESSGSTAREKIRAKMKSTHGPQPTICHVEFQTQADNSTGIMGKFDEDQEELELLLTFFADEISFDHSEVIGLTRTELMELFTEKDVAFLQR